MLSLYIPILGSGVVYMMLHGIPSGYFALFPLQGH